MASNIMLTLLFLGAVLAVLLVWKLLFSRRRYRYGRSVGGGRRGYRGGRRR